MKTVFKAIHEGKGVVTIKSRKVSYRIPKDWHTSKATALGELKHRLENELVDVEWHIRQEKATQQEAHDERNRIL